MMKKLSRAILLGICAFLGVQGAQASDGHDLLIRFKDQAAMNRFLSQANTNQIKVEKLGLGLWVRAQTQANSSQNYALQTLKLNPDVAFAQPNYKIRLIEDYAHNGLYSNPDMVAEIARMSSDDPTPADDPKPELPILMGSGGAGADPLAEKQWGMIDIGAPKAWSQTRGKGVIVAVIDSGVDYTHEDLMDNMWRNPGELGWDDRGHNKANNGVDDDANGYVDDVMGWDFTTNDNKPYDVHGGLLDVLLKGMNPGHGTHCSGNVAARGNNGKGIAGVAPEATIMPLRFITKAGQGDTADAIKAINYAIANGAKVISNSWGSEGDDPTEDGENRALKEVITSGQEKGVLFIFAAGNGHNGVGYDNDTDPKPGVPASYAIDNIVSVAAVDSKNNLGSFSNWGAKTVHLAAPGVEIFSTTVGSHYQGDIIDILGLKVGWDGTSMATPHVAGAAALYWAKHPQASWRDVKTALLSSVTPIPQLAGKCVSGGKLNVEKLLAN